MHPRVILAIIRKEFLDIWLNRSALGTLIGPIFLSLIWLLISNLATGSKNSILIYNPSNSSLAQVVVQAFPDAQVVQASSAKQVETAFGPNGASIKTDYTAGLVLPENFDNAIRAGKAPTLSLYLNGNSVTGQTQGLLEGAIINYARTIASPQVPVMINTILVNPPSTQNAGVILKQIYAPLALLASLMVGITFIPLLLLEEKEKKTLRMLLVTPASFVDILAGKLLFVLVFQLAITSVVLAILGSFSGSIPLLLLFVVLGASFSLSTGLLLGSLFNTPQAASTVAGLFAVIFIVSGIFVGQLGELIGNSTIVRIVHFIPTYYIADGAINAAQNTATLGSVVLDVGISIASTIILLAISVWALRRQASIIAVI